MSKVIEIRNAIQNQIPVSNIVWDQWIYHGVELSKLTTVAIAFTDHSGTGSVVEAEPISILVDGPGDKVAISIEGWLFVVTTEPCVFAQELINAEDGKNTEDKGQEEENINEARDGSQERLDQVTHGWHGIDRPEWSEDTEGTEGLETLSLNTDHIDDTYTHYEEIETVPWVSQVRFLAYNEAHTKYFGRCFKDEYAREDKVDLTLSGLPL